MYHHCICFTLPQYFYGEMGFEGGNNPIRGMEGLPSTLRFKDGISYGLIAFTGGDIQMFIAIFSAIFITSEFVHGTMKIPYQKVIIVLWYTLRN